MCFLRRPRLSLYFMMVLALAMASLGLVGCRPAQSQEDRAIIEANKRVQALSEEVNRLYEVYLRGDRQEAKFALEQMVSVEEGSDAPLYVRAHGLWLIYSRLYVLEIRGGNDVLAQACLLKARYWLLRKAELHGDNPEKAASKAFNWFTPDKCMEIVDNWDKSRTQGKGPNYAQADSTRP
jgi:hypothetical protein